MKRPEFITLLGGAAAALPLAARAQQAPSVPRLGVLLYSNPQADHQMETIRRALRDLGHIEGRNIVIEYRYAQGKPERLPELAAELVRLRPAVILAIGGDVADCKEGNANGAACVHQTVRRYCCVSDPWRTAPSIRTDLVFRSDRRIAVLEGCPSPHAPEYLDRSLAGNRDRCAALDSEADQETSPNDQRHKVKSPFSVAAMSRPNVPSDNRTSEISFAPFPHLRGPSVRSQPTHVPSVLLQGRKSANIHASSGVIRGIPVKGRKPSCGKRSDIVGRRRRSARHALKKLPTKTRASFLSGFGIPGLARRTDTNPPARPGQAIARRQLGRPPALWQSVLRRLLWCEGNL
jgi:hypothetical protein